MTVCGAVDACQRTDTRLYPAGLRCPEHTPAAMNGRPEPPDPAMSAARLPPPREHRPADYGTARTDPLGRDGPGWKINKQTRLPTRVKAAGDDDDN